MFENQIEAFKEQILPIKTANLNSEILETLTISSVHGSFKLKHVSVIEQINNQIIITVWNNDYLNPIAGKLDELKYSYSAAKNKLIINIPVLTKEQENKIVSQLKELLEQYKVHIRNERKVLRESVDVKSEDDKRKCLSTIDKLSEKAIKEIEIIFNNKIQKLTKC